jgi:ribosomal protein S18 acetylase RimI-like enzyme
MAGVFDVRLELRASNAEARAFYTALGYRECGTVRAYYSGLEDAHRMRRDLRVSGTAEPSSGPI